MAGLRCSNPGCGSLFDEQTNLQDSCVYHNGEPVFHEGMKEWSCCKVKSSDFDEFMTFKGCARGKHIYKPPKPAPKPAVENYDSHAPPVPQEFKLENSLFGFRGPKKAEAKKDNDKVKEEELCDPDGAEIPENASCLRPSCTARYNSGSENETCVFHSGIPVFHEGGKGWSCCKRVVSDFDQFLEIKGCKTGKHRFIKTKAENKVIALRHDWYQTQTTVFLSVFAKNTDPEKTKVEIKENEINLEVHFKNSDQVSIFTTSLFDKIDVDKSSYEYLSTKIELTLKKRDNLSWAALNSTTDFAKRTTFGVDLLRETIKT